MCTFYDLYYIVCSYEVCRSDYWGYFEPIREYMPQNCSNDVQAVITYIDETFTSGTTEEIDVIKTLFNMNLTHLDDFAGARKSCLRYREGAN